MRVSKGYQFEESSVSGSDLYSSDSSDGPDNKTEPIEGISITAVPRPKEWTYATFYKRSDDEILACLSQTDADPESGFPFSSKHMPGIFLSDKHYYTVTWFIQRTGGNANGACVRFKPMKTDKESPEAFKIRERTKHHPDVNVYFQKGLPNLAGVKVHPSEKEPWFCGFGATVDGQYYNFRSDVVVESWPLFNVSIGGFHSTRVFTYTLHEGSLVSCSGNAFPWVIYAVVEKHLIPEVPRTVLRVRCMAVERPKSPAELLAKKVYWTKHHHEEQQ